MKTALIGYTGFVGSNLARQNAFDDLYNSSDIQDIVGKEYDLIVSAGARAEKWRINQEPEKDMAELEQLMGYLKQVKAKEFVLISTVDVYKKPVDVNEDTELDLDGLHPYGANRIALEDFIKETFQNSLIVRLPGLFGEGLKKNVIYDFLHDNNVHNIHHGGSFQYYNLANIWKDIQTARDNKINLINFATEPIVTSELASYCFGIKDFKNEPDGVSAGSYDMHTKYAKAYGQEGDYLYSRQQVLDEIKAFVESLQQWS